MKFVTAPSVCLRLTLGLLSVVAFLQFTHSSYARIAGYAPDRILIKVKSNVTETEAQNLITARGAVQSRLIERLGVRVLNVPPSKLADVLAALANNPAVEFAEPDYVIAPAFTPSDPYFGSQWHLPQISAPGAWNVTLGSGSVIVAILDTGVDGSHPDLAPRMVAGWNTYDNNSNTGDVYGHGTSVAGVAAGAGNNGIGIASVALDCLLMPVRISDPLGYAYDSTAANGLTWAADHGARVANISYEFSGSATVSSAAKYFQSKGGVVCVSAGNDSSQLSLPDNAYMLTVSATDGNNALASWSNTGNVVDLAAPGVGILTTTAGGGYGSGSGTSFSSPIVAGVAALVISANPSLSGSQIQQVLKQSAQDLGAPGWDLQYGWGLVNAQQAVNLALTITGTPTSDTAPPTVNITPGNGSIVAGTIAVQGSASDNVGVYSMKLSVDGILVASWTASLFSYSWDTTPFADGTHTLAATATDAAGNSASSTVSVSVRNHPDLTAPVVAIPSPVDGTTTSSVNVSVTAISSDNIGVTRVQLYVDNVLTDSSTSSQPSFRWNTKKCARGAHQVQVRASDAAGNIGYSSTVRVFLK